MRILYCSNGPWAPSGYGVQGKSLLPRLRELPQVDDIAVFAWYGLQGGIWEWDGMTIYPMHREIYGNDMYRAHADHFKADVVITLIDPWVLHSLAEKLDPIEWWPWFPIDGEPVSQYTLKAIQGAKQRLVYSKWAQKLLTDVGVDTTYIPHGIETNKFKVLEPGDVRNQFRKYHFGEDAEFVVTMVAANKGEDDRKAFGYQLQAFERFARDKPGVKMWMHTTPGLESKGVDIAGMATLLGIVNRLRFPVPYQYAMGYPVDWMSALYNSSDVFLGAAKAEGFGIPLIEAQACGIPVITSDFSSQPELVRWGTTIPTIAKEWCHLNIWRSIPSVDGIHEALEILYDKWQENGKTWPLEQRVDVQNKIHSEFGWDHVVKDYWAPLIRDNAK